MPLGSLAWKLRQLIGTYGVKYCEEMFLFWFRYKLPIVFIIINNSGIYQGLPQEQWEDVMKNEDPYVK